MNGGPSQLRRRVAKIEAHKRSNNVRKMTKFAMYSKKATSNTRLHLECSKDTSLGLLPCNSSFLFPIYYMCILWLALRLEGRHKSRSKIELVLPNMTVTASLFGNLQAVAFMEVRGVDSNKIIHHLGLCEIASARSEHYSCREKGPTPANASFF